MWVTFSLVILLVVFMVLGYGKQDITNFFQARFPEGWSFTRWGLDNYYKIYQKLKILENSPPFPHGKQNFFAIARHYIPIIYFFGFLETFVKILFPFFILLLFGGFRHALKRTHIFIIVILTSYLLTIYYTLLMRDFISKRFLFAAAFMLYPWVGMGMERIFTFVKQSLRPKLFTTIFVLVFIISPLYKCIDVIGKHDKVIGKAGEWLASQTVFHEANIITTDLRFILYARRKINFPIDSRNAYSLKHFLKLNDFISLEQLALRKQMDLLVFRVSLKRKNSVPKLKYYRKAKEFTGEKNIAIIYCSEDLYRKLNHKDIGYDYKNQMSLQKEA